MRRAILLLTAFVLVGCGQGGAPTPLAHAIAALEAGDYADYQKAKMEADEALKTAIQPGQDLCKITVNDMVKYSDVARIARFDHPELFKLPDDDRLVYALTVAGGHWVVEPGSFLASAPLVRSIEHGYHNECQKYDSSEIMANMAANASLGEASEDARTSVLKAWIDTARQRYGDGFDDKMRSASVHLDSAGFSGKWPSDSELISGPKPIPTFESVQHSVSHRS